jgi:hypothetical protein
MRREDCVEMFQRIPEAAHAQINIITRVPSMIAVDVLVRCEPHYLVVRGREGGSTDEGRAFFLPYEEISYLRIDRVVKLSEMKRMYGEEGYQDTEDKLGQQAEAEEKAAKANQQLIATPAPVPTPAPPTDPASIAKQNLLDRIRAARASAGGVTGKLK